MACSRRRASWPGGMAATARCSFSGMAHVKDRDGGLWECKGKTMEEMKKAIDEAKKAGSDFVKCGGRYIRTSEIVIITERETAPEEDDDDEAGWPVIKIIIEGGKAQVVQVEDE